MRFASAERRSTWTWLWGGLVVLAWLVLATAFGSSQASAAEHAKPGAGHSADARSQGKSDAASAKPPAAPGKPDAGAKPDAKQRGIANAKPDAKTHAKPQHHVKPAEKRDTHAKPQDSPKQHETSKTPPAPKTKAKADATPRGNPHADANIRPRTNAQPDAKAHTHPQTAKPHPRMRAADATVPPSAAIERTVPVPSPVTAVAAPHDTVAGTTTTSDRGADATVPPGWSMPPLQGGGQNALHGDSAPQPLPAADVPLDPDPPAPPAGCAAAHVAMRPCAGPAASADCAPD